jgi:hypothetical protein
MNPEITTDTEPEDLANREAPSQFSLANSADHSWLALAHSPDDHGPGEFDQHDTHGGSIWADVYLPTNEDHKVRDSNAGVFILDHLGCTFGCLDEYHQFYADPERLIFQVGEIPNQAEFVGRDPDRYVFGFGSYDDGTPQNLNPTLQPVTNPLFDATNPVIDPVVSSTTGVDGDGDAQGRSPCCAADPNQDGHFCNRNAGGSAMGVIEDQVGAGCADIDEQNCAGGGVGADGVFRGCVVVNGEETVEGGESCTAAAVAGCCSDPNNAACM